MTTLYLILTIGACSCPPQLVPGQYQQGITFTNVSGPLIGDVVQGTSGLNATLPTATTITTVQCGSSDVQFSTSKERADNALVSSSRVWKISTMPLKIDELKREATTVYLTKSQPVEVK